MATEHTPANGALTEDEWRKHGQWVPSLSLFMASFGSVNAMLAQRPASYTLTEIEAALRAEASDHPRINLCIETIVNNLPAYLQPAPKTPEERVTIRRGSEDEIQIIVDGVHVCDACANSVKMLTNALIAALKESEAPHE
jgi:hypothetical protein